MRVHVRVLVRVRACECVCVCVRVRVRERGRRRRPRRKRRRRRRRRRRRLRLPWRWRCQPHSAGGTCSASRDERGRQPSQRQPTSRLANGTQYNVKEGNLPVRTPFPLLKL